ncbi:MAG: response regulator [Actinobacteria bacterium]|jgi:response regulator NasT|nr:response regulator [Actinomycetota bacterium]MDA2984688.1 response regulator [Actinomycetota bacterium]
MAYRIVVAEDEALIRLDLIEMLTEAGYEVVASASNGIEAVDLVKQFSPDLVILDVKMPLLDGISAAGKISGRCAVLFLTAFSQRELIERASEAGALAYIVKPFTIDDLTPSIEIAITRFKELKALEFEVADIHQRLETRKIIERAKGVLMEALQLSEPAAFSWIQREAMDKRMTMKAVAEAVVEPSFLKGFKKI